MAGPTRISQLTDGAPVQETDQIPVARGSGSTGLTYKVNAGRLVSDLLNVTNSPSVNLSFNSSTRTLSADVATAVDASVNVVDSPTIDLNWNASTRTLSASLSSISSFFTGTNQSLLSSGYQKLPGGLIIQWGYVNDSSTTRSFPVTFPNQCISMTGNEVWDAYASGGEPVYVWVVSSSQYRIRQGTIPGNANMFWMALGY